jgi:uncharacterized membrane protein YbhN (UPF0104 family)
VAVLAVAYETLTCMAAGALLAAILVLLPFGGQETHLGKALVLLALAGVPALPWVFNPLARRVVAPFQRADAEPLPHFRSTTLLGGLALNLVSWFFLGASLWATVRAIQPYDLGLEQWFTCIAYISIATVVGFLTIMPGGLGVREAVLTTLFEPALGASPALVAALLLRLTWIISEVVAAGVLYPLPLVCSRKQEADGLTPKADEFSVAQEPADRDLHRHPGVQ